MEETNDSLIHERALLWKMEAISEVHRAAFRTDPLAGLLDTAVLCGQMRDYFRDGDGADLFGAWQPIAIEAADTLHQEVWRLGESLSLSGDPAVARQTVDDYVAANPIEGQLFLRESVEPLLMQVIDRRKAGASATLGSLNELTDDLSKRLTIYAQHLPREARWQAEYAALRLARSPEVEEARTALESAARSHELFANSVAAALELVQEEREILLHELELLSSRRIDDVDRQRQETLAMLQSEREEVMRVLLTQTQEALATLRQERELTLSEVERMLEGTVSGSFDRVDDLADRLMVRILFMVGVASAALLLAAVVFGLLIRRRQAADRP